MSTPPVAVADVRTVCCAGTGVIGGGWAAYFLAHGYDVVAWDPAPGAEERLRHLVDAAWPALTELGLSEGADRVAAQLRARPGEGPRRRAVRAGERAGGPRPQASAARRHRRGGTRGHRDLVLDVGLRHERDVHLVPAPRAPGRRAPVQPAVPDPARRGRRWRQDLRRGGRLDLRLLPPRREVGDHHGPRGPGLHRQPAAGGAVARGAAHGGRGRGDGRADRPVHHRRPRAAVAGAGTDADLPPRRWAGRDGAHARPLRSLAEVAVDPARRRRPHPRAPRRRRRRAASARPTAAPSTSWWPNATPASSRCCARSGAHETQPRSAPGRSRSSTSGSTTTGTSPSPTTCWCSVTRPTR